jgi:hypothetical protein
MNALAKRNLTTHTYNEDNFYEVITFVDEKFTPIVEQLFSGLKKEIASE